MDTVKSDLLAPGGEPTAQGVAPVAKTYLVTLPRELVIEIIETCYEMSGSYHWRRYYSSRERRIVVSLSCVNKCLRTLCIPILFRDLRLMTQEDELHAYLKALVGNEAILEAARYLCLLTFGPGSPWSVRDPFPPKRPCKALTPALLVKVLSKMSLMHLELDFRDGHKSLAPWFRKELVAQRVTLPTITLLDPPPSEMVDLVPSVFPNLRNLTLNIHRSPKKTPGLIAIAPELQRLDFLELKNGWTWDLTALEEIAELFPLNLRLVIAGSLEEDGMSGLISVFKKMANLDQLHFWSKDPKFPVKDLGRRMNQDFALNFFRQCLRLEVLNVNNKVYYPVRQGDSVVEVETS